MKIVTKIYIFCLTLVCVFCFIFTFSVYQQKKIIHIIEDVIERDLEITEDIARLTTYQLQFSIHIERVALHTFGKRMLGKTLGKDPIDINFKDEYLEKFNSLLSEIQSNINVHSDPKFDNMRSLKFSDLEAKIKKIKALHEDYMDVSSGWLNHVKYGDIEDISLYEISFVTIEDEINYFFESTLFEIQSSTAQSIGVIRNHERKVYKIYLLGGCLLLVLICIFLVAVIVRIKKSIQRAVQFAEDIEAGNRQPATTAPSADEIGRIVHAMEFMLSAINKAEEELKRIGLTDSLTGIANRLMFNTTLEREVERVKRYKQPLSLIMFDIDHFKRFNDAYGHDAGDKVLIELTDLIARNVRTVDLFARWGGEEFMILSSNTKIDESSTLAEKLRVTIEKHSFSDSHKVTCSFGLAEYLDEDIDTLLKTVDLALYKSKESGRNKVTISNTLQHDSSVI